MTFSSIVIFSYLWLSRAWTTPIAKANKLSSASPLGQTFVKIREINVSFGSFAIGENNLAYAIFVLVDCFQLWISSGIAWLSILSSMLSPYTANTASLILVVRLKM